MTAIKTLFKTRKPAQEGFEEALDPEQLHPPLGRDAGLGKQLVERGQELMAQLKPLVDDRERLVTAHGERALAAELDGHPLDAEALEEHERALAVLNKQISRLTGQMDAVQKAIPKQEVVIASRREEAAVVVGERIRELARPNVAELRTAYRTILTVLQRDRALRDAAGRAFEDLGQREHAFGRFLPWIMPQRLENGADLSAWEREMTAAGLLEKGSFEDRLSALEQAGATSQRRAG